MAFLSIIIPTYNSESTIDICLHSLAAQNFRDFEVLIIDGLSTDRTIEKAKDFFINNPDIKHVILCEKDNGIFDAMNKGALKASGDWLYFLGSDDWLYSDNIFSRVYPELYKKDCAEFVYGNAWLDETKEVYDGKFSLRTILKANICHQAIFVKKTLFDEIGPFDLRFKVHADWDFNVKVFLSKKKTQYIDILVVQYSTQGYSSQNRDLLFEEKLNLIKEDYYQYFLHRLNSKYHYIRKRMKKYFLG